MMQELAPRFILWLLFCFPAELCLSIAKLESIREMNSCGLNNFAKAMSEKQPGSIKEVVKILTELVTKLDSFASDIKSDVARISTSNGEVRSSLQRSVQFLSDGFEKLKPDVQAVRGELSMVGDGVAQWRTESELLKKELKQDRSELTEFKQCSRNTNVEIQGLPVVPEQDLLKEVGKLAGCLKANIRDSDIDVVHRVPSKDKRRPHVIVKFRSRAARDRMLSAAKKTECKGFGVRRRCFHLRHWTPLSRKQNSAS